MLPRWICRHPLLGYFALTCGTRWGGVFVSLRLDPSVAGLTMTALLERRGAARTRIEAAALASRVALVFVGAAEPSGADARKLHRMAVRVVSGPVVRAKPRLANHAGRGAVIGGGRGHRRLWSPSARGCTPLGIR